jgi:hypothetical protein
MQGNKFLAEDGGKILPIAGNTNDSLLGAFPRTLPHNFSMVSVFRNTTTNTTPHM